MRRKETRKSDFKEFGFWAHKQLRNRKKHVRLWNRSILMSELGVKPNYDFGSGWAGNRRKNQTSTNSASELPNPLEMVKKTCKALDLSILMFELGVIRKLWFWAEMSRKQTRKNLTWSYSASEITNPLEMVKKLVRLLNRSITMYELGHRPKWRFWANLSRKRTRKIGLQRILLLSLRTLRNGKNKHFRLLNRSILMSKVGVRPKLRVWDKMSKKQTRKNWT